MKGPKFWQPNRLFDLLDNVIKHAWFLPDLLIHEKSATYIRIRIRLEFQSTWWWSILDLIFWHLEDLRIFVNCLKFTFNWNVFLYAIQLFLFKTLRDVWLNKCTHLHDSNPIKHLIQLALTFNLVREAYQSFENCFWTKRTNMHNTWNELCMWQYCNVR